MAHHQEGRPAEAEVGYLAVAAAGYRRVEVLALLAGIAAADGRLELALDRWRAVLDEQPGHLQGLIETGSLLHRAGRWAEAAETLKIAAAVDPDNEFVTANLGVALLDAGRRDEALAALRRAAARLPDLAIIQHQMRRAASAVVPFWHIPMMNDAPRNEAFEQAIIRAVARHGPEAQVLEIGAGSGLLSMMAARAGAWRVNACECVPAIAEIAETVTYANGYGDRIRVVPKMSTALVVGEDLPEPADILISEILSSDLLTENVLPTFEDALARLVKPGATILPKAVAAIGCLIGSEVLARSAFVGSVSGFDLSAFTALAPQRLPVDGMTPPWTRLSPDRELAHLDLTRRHHPPTLTRLALPVEQDGIAVGVLQWMNVDLGDGISFSNPPDRYHGGGWMQILHTFPHPVEVKAGQTVEVTVGHDRTSLVVVLSESGEDSAPASDR